MISAAVEPTPAAVSPSDAAVTDWLALFALLSDRTRLRILYQLSRHDELHVGALCERLAQRQPAVSHHLSRLREAGVLEVRRDGKQRFYRLRSDRVGAVLRAVSLGSTDNDRSEIHCDRDLPA